jgi:hypothetical protein
MKINWPVADELSISDASVETAVFPEVLEFPACMFGPDSVSNRLRSITEHLRPAGVPARIQNGHFSITVVKGCRLGQLAGQLNIAATKVTLFKRNFFSH